MFDASVGLLNRAAFDREYDVAWAPLGDINDPTPIDHAVAAGASDGSAGDLAAFSTGMLNADVFGVQMDRSLDNPLEPCVRVLAREVGIAGVEVDAHGR